MPRTTIGIKDIALLTAALEGLQLQQRRLDEQIAEVRMLLGKAPGKRGRAASSGAKRGPGRMSDAARKRIAAAQKRRWAEYRKSAGKSE